MTRKCLAVVALAMMFAGVVSAQDAKTVALRQSQIGQHERRPVLLHRAHRLALFSGFDDHVAVAFDRQLQHAAERIVVFDEENGERHGTRDVQRSQPAGTFARRASSSMSAIALVCLTMSALTRSCSAMAASRFCSMAERRNGSSMLTNSV